MPPEPLLERIVHGRIHLHPLPAEADVQTTDDGGLRLHPYSKPADEPEVASVDFRKVVEHLSDGNEGVQGKRHLCLGDPSSEEFDPFLQLEIKAMPRREAAFRKGAE